MSSLQVIARFKIHPGKQAEFKALVPQFGGRVRQNEPGARQYDGFLTPDETECMVIETYDDSAAVFAHVANVGGMLGDMAAHADLQLELCGSPSEELAAAVAEMGVKVHSPLDSL
jgi:quinol monooxygenase YgiN